MNFENLSGAKVYIFWVNSEDGVETPMGDIESGHSLEINTYDSDTFRIRSVPEPEGGELIQTYSVLPELRQHVRVVSGGGAAVAGETFDGDEEEL